MLPQAPTPSTSIRQTFEQDRYLHQLLQHQAKQLAGQPGWPLLPSCVYEQLLRQIEADVMS